MLKSFVFYFIAVTFSALCAPPANAERCYIISDAYFSIGNGADLQSFLSEFYENTYSVELEDLLLFQSSDSAEFVYLGYVENWDEAIKGPEIEKYNLSCISAAKLDSMVGKIFPVIGGDIYTHGTLRFGDFPPPFLSDALRDKIAECYTTPFREKSDPDSCLDAYIQYGAYEDAYKALGKHDEDALVEQQSNDLLLRACYVSRALAECEKVMSTYIGHRSVWKRGFGRMAKAVLSNTFTPSNREKILTRTYSSPTLLAMIEDSLISALKKKSDALRLEWDSLSPVRSSWIDSQHTVSSAVLGYQKEKPSGRDLCNITLTHKSDLIDTASNRLMKRVSIKANVDLVKYMHFVFAEKGRFAFNGAFSDRIIFEQTVGVEIAECSTLYGESFTGPNHICEGGTLSFEIEKGKYESIQEKLFSLMVACHTSFRH